MKINNKYPSSRCFLIFFAVTGIIFFETFPPNMALSQGKKETNPEEIDLLQIGDAIIKISFTGEILLDGKTKSITYTQPIPTEDQNQKIIEVTVESPPYSNESKNFHYEIIRKNSSTLTRLTWENIPNPSNISYTINVKVQRTGLPIQLTSQTGGKDIEMLRSGELTASSPEIKKVVSSIKKNTSNDLETALKIIEWIQQNIQYDPKYSQNKKDKPAPKVINNKRGTCDEISHLFISMARTAGIPAREVSGIAFSGNEWGFHSWSELKFGDTWVPFDATNMETGFVDATHIAFVRDFDDARFEQQIVKEGEGGFRVKHHDMKVQIWKASKAKKFIETNLNAIPDEVAPGGKISLEATFKNISDSILTGSARLILPPEFQPLDGILRTFILEKNGTIKCRWNVKTGLAPESSEGIYVYSLSMVTYPRVFAETQVKLTARMIEKVSILNPQYGTISVAAVFKSPFEEEKAYSWEACIYNSWDMQNKIACTDKNGKIQPGKTVADKIDFKYLPTSNFSIVVKFICGGLSESSITNVNIAQGQQNE